MNSPATPIACVIAAIVTAVAQAAHALSCAYPEVVVPPADAVQVPTNTWVWCSKPVDGAASPIRVRTSDGNEVGGTQTQMTTSQFDILVFRPASELAANSTYTVDCPLRYEGQLPSVFSTGPGPRTTPPAVPSLSSVEITAYADGGWGASHFARFIGAGAAETIIVVDLPGGSARLNPAAPSGFVADAHYAFQGEDVWVGNGPCGGNWPAAALGASTRVALGAFDQTGAFSGWSDTVTVTLPTEYADPNDGIDEGDDGDAESSPEAEEDSETVGVVDDAVDVSTNGGDDLPTATGSSRLGRSSCALGAPGSSTGVAAGLVLALFGLSLRRRRPRRA